MSERRGRPPASTEVERERVLELSALGVRVRRIALLVFGDPRFRSRVARILAER